ncbi:hopanoid biosynthesis associated RND transporter like protein HpnN [Rhodoblastus acidophilus]|uniref:hopanoid transporter HpnN n=1 Tax=Rhodoblastus acidophilus TaxID=1074 RepID=UPI002224C6AE|nr:MMPL family transporter [Rhodoblastus acidophilus]MCW2286133.1 hopanoid biosynthesis associated RND transporter like protein HpnN [Rhodoblastus acidophilus]MCW2335027.1 hopanoid biosynthesis associated RND transporter like protein HpnN [Rhodoblastus acidophilus]
MNSPSSAPQPPAEAIRLVARLVAFCARRKWITLLVSLALAVAASWYAAGHFAMSTDLNTLISPDLPWRKREMALSKAFPQRQDTLLAVLDAPSPEHANAAARGLQAALQAQPAHFSDVRSLETSEFFARQGLLYLSTTDVSARMAQLIDAQPFLGALARDPSLRGLAGALALMAQPPAETAQSTAELAKPLASVAEALQASRAGKASEFSWSALFSGAPPSIQDKRRFLQVSPKLDYSELEPGAAASDALRATARNLELTPEHGYRLRLTGDVAMQDEEFGTLAEGAALNNGLMVAAVLLILWRALRWGRLIFAVMANMVVGLALTAAAGLAMVGVLNPISVAFAVLFVGIGVDFGIQFAVRYREERFQHLGLDKAIDKAGAGASLPLSLAAAATAAGFFSFMPTAYRGVSELGLIAGVGMILAFCSSVTLLPALLAILKPPAETAPVGYAFLAPIDRFQTGHRKLIISVAVGLALLGAPLLAQVRFDSNPLNLRSAKVESVSTLLELAGDPRNAPNSIEILTPNLAEAEALAQKLRALPEVDTVSTLSSFVPEDQQTKLAAISDARDLLASSLSIKPIPAPGDSEDVEALRQAAQKLALAPGLETMARALGDLAASPPEARDRARRDVITPMLALLADLKTSLNATAIAVEDLPDEFSRDWIARDGRARVEAWARGDRNDFDNLRKFSAAVRAIAPDSAGAAVSILESGDTVIKAFAQAGALALVSITLLLWLALRRFGDVALTLAPLLLAGVYTMEICVLIDLKLNFANIIALPLLLGLGVAFKIYYVMAWRAGAAELLQTSLTRAIFFSAMTTATAFGSLYLSNHPGTSSMGELLALSLATTLCAAVFFQPALMGPPRKPAGG